MNTTEATIRANNRVHTIYKTLSGRRVPSVTTILAVLAKPALIKWAHGLGLKGIDMDGYVDELAGIGTLAHRMILDHLRGDKTACSAYSPQQVDLAENCFLKYLEWERQHSVEPMMVETPRTSDDNGFGGTPDFYGIIDGELCLMDFKTGKAIYSDYWYQLGGYSLLLAELPTTYRILNIGRSEDEQFVEETRTNIDREREVFLHALAIYKLTHNKGN
jgi:hypothetical protein